ncbi:MAG: hypothetical protein ABH851_02170 [Methanobacteriota archaeon]
MTQKTASPESQPTILTDPNTVKKSGYRLQSGFSRDLANSMEDSLLGENRMQLMELAGIDLMGMTEPFLEIGPTFFCEDEGHFPILLTAPYRFENISTFIIVEPDAEMFPQLVDAAQAVAPEQRAKLILINEEADHLHWTGREGSFVGIADESVRFARASSVFQKEVMSQEAFVKSFHEISRTLMPGGVFFTPLSRLEFADQGWDFLPHLFKQCNLEPLDDDKLRMRYLRKKA